MGALHDYDALFPELEHRFKLRGREWTLRSPGALARVEEHRVQLIDCEGSPGKPDFKPSLLQMAKGKCAYLAMCIEGEGGASPSALDLEGWPEPVIDDLYERAKAYVEGTSKNSSSGAESTSQPPAS